jgi:hypothetical protein
LREAISFVMKEMPAQQRGTAVINVDGQQTLQIDEIEQMYRHPDFATTGAQ